MSWQRKARLGLAVFVVVFTAIVFVTFRRARPPVSEAPGPQLTDPKAVSQTTGGLTLRHADFEINAESQLIYPDGRTVYKDATLELPDRGGRSIRIRADEVEAVLKEGTDVESAILKGSVRLETSDGVVVTAGEATYNSKDALLTVPGPVAFSKGRMSGTGVGATYDHNREVLWLLDQAHITVAADPQSGDGPIEVTSGAAGLASADHFAQLTRGARITSAGRLIEADDITVRLTPDNERVQMLQLRVNSRITGASGSAQSMTARDIDLEYGDDGRTLRRAHLVDNAVVELPPEGQAAGRSISGRTIDLTMSPDGETLTGLVAAENVQLDLPAAAGGPARRITATRFEASGAPGAGLQSGTFTGNVDYQESRPVRGASPVIERTAQSQRLTVQTRPGLGAIEQADFRGNVRITNGTDVTAEAPRAVYRLADESMRLSPGEGDPGPQPQVTDGRATIAARTIDLDLATGSIKADTDVRSTLRPARDAGERGPAILDDSEPVNITANSMTYDGKASVATYSGNATLWQQGQGNKIQAATIIIDDKSGNLTARDNVRTVMYMTEAGQKRSPGKTSPMIGGAEVFVYDDAKRLATYTTNAVIDGPQGHLTADTIELFLTKASNELERAEAHGAVTVREGGRIAWGTHLRYTAENDEYVMTGAVGAPVVVVEDKPSGCERTQGNRLTFRRAAEQLSMEAPITRPCTAGDRR